MFRRVGRIHMVGVGGAGMSGIAELLANLGFQVSGSDLRESAVTKRLIEAGVEIFYGHRAEQIGDAEVVVQSTAVKKDNPEILAAGRKGIPVIPRAEMLAELMRLKTGIAVAGTHGKTTTTSFVASIIAKAGLDPTIVIGGRLNALGSGAKLGAGEYLVAEADESDGSFLFLSPTLSIITNIEPEHLDHYGSVDAMCEAYRDFANKVPFYGSVIVCLDSPMVQQMLPEIRKRHITYGLSRQAEFQALDIHREGFGSRFDVSYRGEVLGRINLKMPGDHNILNALAALAVAHELEVPFAACAAALAEFSGIGRRFERKGAAFGVEVYDDYAHHPSEIKATLAAARQCFDGRIIALFQPHRHTRTRDCFDEFATSFNQADAVFVTDIYAAGEEAIEGVNAESLAEAIRKHGHHDVRYVAGLDTLADEVALVATEGDVLFTLGAGSIWQVGEAFLAKEASS